MVKRMRGSKKNVIQKPCHAVLLQSLWILLLGNIFSFTVSSAQSVFTIHGRVIDAATTDPLPMASIRFAQSTQGTVTNENGEFHYSVSDSSVKIIASYVGYGSDTMSVSREKHPFCLFRLQPNAVKMSEVLVTGSTEDPAYDIIRQAIANKKKWQRRLHSYEGKAFTRVEVRLKDTIAAITESYSTLYWQQDDTLREVITQQKQTGNIKKIPPVRSGNILNFNDDTIKLSDYSFVGPTAPEAFEYYDYKLLMTQQTDGYDVYAIQVIPKSRIEPLFRGTIKIAERSYAVIDADLEPNEAFHQPFINIKQMRFQQAFRLYQDAVWLPVNFQYQTKVDIRVLGFNFPSVVLSRDVVVYDYNVNLILPDTVRLLKPLTVDSTSKVVDTLFWTSHNILPLTEAQQRAYQSLDSAQTLEKQFAPTGTAYKVLTSLSGGVFSYLDVAFNRVEGAHLGLSKSFDSLSQNMSYRGGFAYGTKDHQWKWNAGATYHFGEDRPDKISLGGATLQVPERTYALGFDLYRQIENYPSSVALQSLINSVSVLFTHDDENDYYLKKGGNIEFMIHPYQGTRFNVTALSEYEYSVIKNTEFSLFNKSAVYRENPPIIDGQMNSVRFTASYVSSPVFTWAHNAFEAVLDIEHSAPAFKSDFSFTQMDVKLSQKISTMNPSLAFPPSLTLYAFGGTSIGHLPPQRYFSLSPNVTVIGIPGMLRAVDPREFWGDQYLEFFSEYNFRRAPFALSGIKALYESNLELIVYGGAAKSWLTHQARIIPGVHTDDTRSWYYEVGVGISNIYDLFRIDFTYRFMSPEGLRVNVTLADFISGLIRQ